MINIEAEARIKMNELGSKKIPFLFIIDYEKKMPLIIPLSEVRQSDILFEVNGFKNFRDGAVKRSVPLRFYKNPVNRDVYKAAYDKVQRHFISGNSFLVNLTFPTSLEMNASMEDIFYLSEAKYKLLYRGQFVVFSPEIFVKIENGTISSYPMKGTRCVSENNALENLLSDEKEMAEHITIVDLIRNDLSMVSSDVCVESFRYIDRIKTNEGELLQVSSKITGKLSPSYFEKIGDILFTLLPAGSICGAPKPKTLEIIREAENYSRGYYTGVFGYFDGSRLDSGVMIRFIEKSADGSLIFKSGGGITIYSDMEKEYEEMVRKVYVPIS